MRFAWRSAISPTMSPAIGILLFLGTIALMEGVAYAAHRWVMHGPGWFLHKSHHEPSTGMFELNDRSRLRACREYRRPWRGQSPSGVPLSILGLALAAAHRALGEPDASCGHGSEREVRELRHRTARHAPAMRGERGHHGEQQEGQGADHAASINPPPCEKVKP